ncbi:MAG: hypothetical protein BWY61_01910 [Firmicutes bacterium ADurb.Bin354]|nr:MAG: hypothetical protein BWY61_01910 [Firmicutes bacterium ADurb.Bin354]
MVSGFCLDKLKCGTDRICSGIGGTAEKCISVSHLYQHGSEIVGVREHLFSLLVCHTF